MRLVALLLAFVAVLAAAGCSGSVSGQVSSKSAQKPVPTATVKVGDQTAATDTSGHFTIDKVDTGSQKVTVSARGFGPYAQSLNVQRGSNTLNVALEDGTVHGTLKENAVVVEPIAKAVVTIGGKSATMTNASHFAAEDVPVGTQQLVVVAPGHARYAQQITVVPGENPVTVRLRLTPVETYMRYYAAYRFNRMREAHRFVHPDVKRHEGYKAFVKSMKQGGLVIGIKLFGSRTLSKWHAAFAKKTYRHVVAIDRSVRYQDAYGTYSDNYTQHWQQISGRWYIIYDWTP
jgi:hypothetical protein